MKQFKKWCWVIITILSFTDIVYVSISEGFIEGKVWPFFVTLALGLYFCYRNFIKKVKTLTPDSYPDQSK